MLTLKDKVMALMLNNRRISGTYQYTVPSPDSYPYQWFWDSCFHAIILSHFSLSDAKKELLSLISKQFENGMIPHIIMWQKNPPGSQFRGDVISWGKNNTSSITQPPMLAYACWQIYQKDYDKSFLQLLYQPLKKLYNYFLFERDPRANHLIGIINPDESGEDNSPRFDQALNLSSKQEIEENFRRRLRLIEQNKSCNFDASHCMKNFFWIKDVPLNSIMVENLRILADIALELGQEKEADLYFIHAKLIVEAMRKLMYADGVFWSTLGPNYQKIKVKTWAIFAPLFAHIYSLKEAADIVDNNLSNQEEFATPFLVPTVSQKEPSFDPLGFWRGPIWMATNWFIFQGLKKYALDSQAKKILNSCLNLLDKSGFREQYNPLTGDGQGARNFTWGGLVLDMIET